MRQNPSRGSALIEFAIALAVLTPVFIGGWQFFEAYMVLEEAQAATIRGAISAAALPYDSPTETPTPGFRRAVEDAVLRSGVPGLQREQVGVVMHFEAGRPTDVEVRISGLRLQVPGGAITLDGNPRASYPYRGHWSASAR